MNSKQRLLKHLKTYTKEAWQVNEKARELYQVLGHRYLGKSLGVYVKFSKKGLLDARTKPIKKDGYMMRVVYEGGSFDKYIEFNMDTYRLRVLFDKMVAQTLAKVTPERPLRVSIIDHEPERSFMDMLAKIVTQQPVKSEEFRIMGVTPAFLPSVLRALEQRELQQPINAEDE